MPPLRKLPARANLEHLRNEAKQRLQELRRREPDAKLTDAQLVVARAYGFPSWRQLKAAVDRDVRDRVFAAARDGDLAAVRRALDRGFDPGISDDAGLTLHQMAKDLGNTDLELLMREYQERDSRPQDVKRAVKAVQDAAADGRADDLRRLLEATPELTDARGGGFARQTALHKAAWKDRIECVRLLLECGADAALRDYGDNASALHFAAAYASIEVMAMLVEAGADVIGDGDDHRLGVLGWATCLGRVREDVAAYLLARGAALNVWSAIALGRGADVRRLVASDPSLLTARMSRNEHRRTPLHHAAAVDRPDMVRLLIELGVPVEATDDTGGTAMTTAALEGAGADVVAALERGGAILDLVGAVALERYERADRLLAEDPARIGPEGRDTVALHVFVAERNPRAVRWLIERGVDVNAKRVLWDCNHTALHVAAERGALDLARMLLDAGADPGVRDDKYEATALGWAEYCGQPAVADLLRGRGVTV